MVIKPDVLFFKRLRNLLHISFFYFCFNFCWFSSFRSDGTKSLFKRKQIIIIWIKYCIKIIPHENTTFISFYWRFTFDPPFFLVWKRDGAIEFVRGWKKISFLFKDKTTNAFRLYMVTKKYVHVHVGIGNCDSVGPDR